MWYAEDSLLERTGERVLIASSAGGGQEPMPLCLSAVLWGFKLLLPPAADFYCTMMQGPKMVTNAGSNQGMSLTQCPRHCTGSDCWRLEEGSWACSLQLH